MRGTAERETYPTLRACAGVESVQLTPGRVRRGARGKSPDHQRDGRAVLAGAVWECSVVGLKPPQ
jgi:hypothetical protein